jgi:hypothetical protein
MKINTIAPLTPTAPSAQPQQARLGTQMSASQQAAKEKAIAMLMGNSANPTGNAQATPVKNPSNISMEEAVNVKAAPESSQTDSVVDPAAAPIDQSVEQPGEEPKEAATQPETPEAPLSSQFAVLARKEKALRAKEQSFRQREAALAAREAGLSQQAAPSASFDASKYISIDDLKSNPYGKLQELGVSYDDLTAQALQSQSPEFQAIAKIRTELQADLQKLKDEQANTRKSVEEQQTAAYQQALRQIKNEASQLVNSDASFETIKETGSVTDVVDLIERTFKEEGTLLTVQEAAQIVEDYLVEEAMKLAGLKKVQARLKPAQSPVQKVEQPQTPPQQQPAQKSVTLTNSMGSARQLSARERAILAAKGELK